MFHPGKVLRIFSPEDPEIFSSDKDVQAMLSMWDENLTTVLVNKKLSGEIKVDDVVLVDYRPISATLPVPRLEVTKVLRGSHAVETWKIYKDKQRSLKGKPLPFAQPPGTPVQPSHSYIG